MKCYLAIAVCVFAVVAGEKPFSKFFAKEYVLHETDSADYENALKAFGVDDARIAKSQAAKPTVVLTNEGDKYKIQIGDLITDTFTLDTPEDETHYGLQVKCTYHAEDEDTLIETLEKDGKTLTLKWDFSDDELKCEVSSGGVTANRVFKKKTA